MLDRIDINPHILGGKPVIKGTRIPVYLILELLQADYNFQKILDAYPALEIEDMKAALEYSIRGISSPFSSLSSMWSRTASSIFFEASSYVSPCE